jgi:uncharacterized protein YegJ (DUF2314 family)
MKIFFVIAFCFLCACNSSNSVTLKQNEKDSTDKIAVYTSEDDKMNAAIDSAKNTFAAFLLELKNPCSSCKDFSVKMRFSFGDGNGEHIWLNDLFFKEERLFGVVGNEPENDVHIKFGDTVEVNRHDLSDWMYIKNDRVVGGYTIKAVYFSLSESEKRQMEKELGAKIEY